MESNRLLPLIGGAVLLTVIFLGFRACGSNDAADRIMLAEVPVAPTPDADSPADTIRTLTAQVADIQAQNKVLESQNTELIKQRAGIASQVRTEVLTDLRQNDLAKKDTALSRLTAQLSGLRSRVETIGTQKTKISPGSDIPIGLGLQGIDGPSAASLIWVEPLGGTGVVDATAVGSVGTPTESVLHPGGSGPNSDSIDTGGSKDFETDDPKDRQPEPVYTVPRNATLIGSTAMTALIGRIPFDGTLEDPFPFKVIVGRDNLAANGLEIPGVDGMIFGGLTSGDWTLSCVRGEVTSVTLVFDDGTIRTVASDDNSLQLTGNNTTSQNQNRPLGYLSDRRGIPCVTGERISNAGSYLAAQFFAKGVEAGAGALATNETTNTVSPVLGVSTSTVTGDALKFAGTNALAGGVEALSEYINTRLAQSFDVIYVDTGREVVVNVDRELPLDYDPNGRKLLFAEAEVGDGASGLD